MRGKQVPERQFIAVWNRGVLKPLGNGVILGRDGREVGLSNRRAQAEAALNEEPKPIGQRCLAGRL